MSSDSGVGAQLVYVLEQVLESGCQSDWLPPWQPIHVFVVNTNRRAMGLSGRQSPGTRAESCVSLSVCAQNFRSQTDRCFFSLGQLCTSHCLSFPPSLPSFAFHLYLLSPPISTFRFPSLPSFASLPSLSSTLMDPKRVIVTCKPRIPYRSSRSRNEECAIYISLGSKPVIYLHTLLNLFYTSFSIDCEESGNWANIEKDLAARLPLRNLVWKPSNNRDKRHISMLDVELKRFSPEVSKNLPPVTLLQNPYLNLYFVSCEVANCL